MTPAELRALATKVEQGTATERDVCEAIGIQACLTKPIRYKMPDGSYLGDCPSFLTSIDAQLKYLPIKLKWVKETRKAFKARWDGRGLFIALGEAPTEPAARLAAILRAMAWERESGA